eukprot:CAMPEP_0116898584 /NCGR_PEP_ID=MMETSP0467-20121206/7295_1 /TAXON_ID=283647 /ORGANISM="Mesodinium pulex, Strain SPMC105" /LENGTH=103 /DNA_ID=CAMNT_0004570835 /DNA_START=765 /DNA_END=1076 /DNA_ORIENTATION=-
MSSCEEFLDSVDRVDAVCEFRLLLVNALHDDFLDVEIIHGVVVELLVGLVLVEVLQFGLALDLVGHIVDFAQDGTLLISLFSAQVFILRSGEYLPLGEFVDAV